MNTLTMQRIRAVRTRLLGGRRGGFSDPNRERAGLGRPGTALSQQRAWSPTLVGVRPALVTLLLIGAMRFAANQEATGLLTQ